MKYMKIYKSIQRDNPFYDITRYNRDISIYFLYF